MLHPGSRFQMAGDLLETYLLWLIEAHAHASEAGRVRIRPTTPNAQIGTRCQRSRHTGWPRIPKPLAHRRPDQRGVDDAGVSLGSGTDGPRSPSRNRGF
jgi:hypothetical protein